MRSRKKERRCRRSLGLLDSDSDPITTVALLTRSTVEHQVARGPCEDQPAEALRLPA